MLKVIRFQSRTHVFVLHVEKCTYLKVRGLVKFHKLNTPVYQHPDEKSEHDSILDSPESSPSH
jgi:hypothetical protein